MKNRLRFIRIGSNPFLATLKKLKQMKMPKGFNRWTLSQQEDYFTKKLQELYDIEQEIRNVLAKIRGGNKMEFKEIERPDEIILKDL
jgi:hypothetical protein